ncbi:hypothetical protein ACN28S_03815 [Cystobacter fuscus]
MSVRFHSPRSLFHRNHAQSSSQPKQLSPSKPLPMPPEAQQKTAPALNKPLPSLPPEASAPTKKLPTPATPAGALLVPVNNNNGMLKTSGNAVNLPGPAPFKEAPGAKPNKLVDAQGPKVEKNIPGATMTAQAGSASLTTVKHNAKGSHQLYVQGEANGPNASFVANVEHEGRLGSSSAQFVADANALKVQGQAGYSLDTRSHAYTANAFLKAETSAGVAGQLTHDFNEHVGVHATGSARPPPWRSRRAARPSIRRTARPWWRAGSGRGRAPRPMPPSGAMWAACTAPSPWARSRARRRPPAAGPGSTRASSCSPPT